MILQNRHKFLQNISSQLHQPCIWTKAVIDLTNILIDVNHNCLKLNKTQKRKGIAKAGNILIMSAI